MDAAERKAFVLMPFGYPFDSYYEHVFKPALTAAGCTVTRADDLFAPRPIMMDIQEAIMKADLVLCELTGRNPNVFYELGLTHAVGKPAILVCSREEDIPFDLQHIRAILYDNREAGWEEKLRRDIVSTASAIGGPADAWPPPMLGARNAAGALLALVPEITLNLTLVDGFLAHSYRVVDGQIVAGELAGVRLEYFTCATRVFDSHEVQSALQQGDADTRDRVLRVYGAFQMLNTKAEALSRVFRPWRAQDFITAVESFQTRVRGDAEALQQTLATDSA